MNIVIVSTVTHATECITEILLYIFSEDDECLEEISALPGQKRMGISHLVAELSPHVQSGLLAVLLFGVLTKSAKVHG